MRGWWCGLNNFINSFQMSGTVGGGLNSYALGVEQKTISKINMDDNINAIGLMLV